MGRRCFSCNSSAYWRAPLIVLILLVMAYFILKVKEMKKRYWTGLSIVFNYFQVLAIFQRLRFDWPPLMLDVFDGASAFSFNLDLFFPPCLSPNSTYFSKWVFFLCIPFFVALLLSLFCFYKAVLKAPFNLGQFQKIDSKDLAVRRERARRRVQKEKLLGLYVIFHLLFYMPAMSKLASIFDCTKQEIHSAGSDKVGNTEWFLDGEPSITCFKGEWFYFLPVWCFFFLLYCVGTFALIGSIAARLTKDPSIRTSPGFVRKYGTGVFWMFKEETSYWGAIYGDRRVKRDR